VVEGVWPKKECVRWVEITCGQGAALEGLMPIGYYGFFIGLVLENVLDSSANS